MITKVPLSELQNRMSRFKSKMNIANPDWELAIIISKINQFYFTGTMQDAVLVIPREGEPSYWVRRSIERAKDESLFENIMPMYSYRDIKLGKLPNAVYMETQTITFDFYARFQAYFPFKDVKPLDAQISAIRAVKSEYELSNIRQSGKIHQRVLEVILPEKLKEGMSETELALEIYSILIKEGHHGVARIGMFDTEMMIGNICFGESSIYPSYFNGPGGLSGMSNAVPIIGNPERKLKKGDLVYIDIGCGYNGYHTDKTTTYMFGKQIPDEAIALHNQCVEIQNKIAGQLMPGKIPSRIYDMIVADLTPEFLENFMGYKKCKVKFIGHGIGLQIDELPVIATGFGEPIQEGMVFALEPKVGIKNIGMVGIENTFIVTKQGGECVTGTNPGLIPVL